MTRNEFRELAISKISFMDGATGSILLKRGMPSGVCNEEWIANNPELITALQREYAEAGSDMILAATFGANAITLNDHKKSDCVEDLNTRLFQISKMANPDKIICGDVSMTGAILEPAGDTSFEELINVYKEQISALAKAGAEVIVIETIITLSDARAAVIAAKEVCDLPIMVTMSFTESGITLYGTSPEAAIITLQAMGVDAIGVNCGVGPDKILPVVERMAKFAKVPLIVKPNAGLPKTNEAGETYYDMTPEEFASHFKAILDKGVYFIGGCCGTSPDFIKAIHKIYADKKVSGNPYERLLNNMVSSQRTGCFLNDLSEDDIVSVVLNDINDNDIIDEISVLSNDYVTFIPYELEKLELALRLYHGIPLVDGRNIEDKNSLLLLADKYGAILKK